MEIIKSIGLLQTKIMHFRKHLERLETIVPKHFKNAFVRDKFDSKPCNFAKNVEDSAIPQQLIRV